MCDQVRALRAQTWSITAHLYATGLIYHPHFRPLTSPVAVVLEAASSFHAKLPKGLPTPSGFLRSLAQRSSDSASLVSPSPLDSVANALTIPPIHVDHVGEAICIAADNAREDVTGVVDVQEMRRLIGWVAKGQASPPPSVAQQPQAQ